MRSPRAHLLAASLAVAATAAGARPLLPTTAVALLQQARSWLSPSAVADAALSPPHLAAPPGTDELALQWQGLTGATNYTLLASDWWSGQPGISRTVYKGTQLYTEVTERVMPGAPLTVVLVASDDTAELARSEAVTYSAAEAGACGNLADATVWRCAGRRLPAGSLLPCSFDATRRRVDRDNWEHLHGDISACLEECGATGGTCTSSCVIARGLLFSKRCAGCWDELHDCAVDHCALPCGFSPKSAKCHTCTENACTSATAECHGIPKWAWTKDST